MVILSWNFSHAIISHANDNDTHVYVDDKRDKELPDDFLCGLISLY